MIGFFLLLILIIQKVRKKTFSGLCKRGLIICIAVFFGTALLDALIPSTKSEEPYPTASEPVKAATEEESKEESAPEKSAEEHLFEAIKGVVGEENLITFNYVPANNFALIKFKGSENFSNDLTIKGMYLDISDILKELQDDIDVNVDFNVVYPMVDKYGNVSEDIVIKATFNIDTIKAINFENFIYSNIPDVADEWWNHNALNLE